MVHSRGAGRESGRARCWPVRLSASRAQVASYRCVTLPRPVRTVYDGVPGNRLGIAPGNTGKPTPRRFLMFKRTLIALAAVALVCGGAVAVASAATGSNNRASPTANPEARD